MASTIVCEGNVTYPVRIGVNFYNLAECDSGWTVIPYVEPTDSTAIYSQLVALNEFDPWKIAGIVTFCCAMFIVGFGAGLVIRQLRRL